MIRSVRKGESMMYVRADSSFTAMPVKYSQANDFTRKTMGIQQL